MTQQGTTKAGAYVRAAFDALPTASRRRLTVHVVLLGLISLLDLFALVLVLAITALVGQAYTRPESTGLSDLPAPLEFLAQLSGVDSVSALAGLLGGTVLVLFVAKSLLACVVLRRALLYLAQQEAQLTHQLMDRLMRAPLTFHLGLRNVDVMTDVTRGTAALVTHAVAPALLIASELLLMTAIAIGLVSLAPVLAAGALLYFGVTFVLLNRWIARRAQTAGLADADTARRALTIVQWSLGGYREVVVRGVAETFVHELGAVTRRGAVNRAEVAYLSVMPRYFLESALVVGLAFTFAVQVPFVGASGAVAGLALFAVAGFRLLPSLNRLQAAFAGISASKPFGERALTLLRATETVQAAPAAVRPAAAAAADLRLGMELDQVSFHYPGSATPALDAVSLSIPARAMTALVGSSGAGKSTLVDVLLGLLPPDTGQVLVDGAPLAGRRSQWLSTVGYVPQQVFLMPASVRENVALGLSDDAIDDEAVWAALRAASLEDVVSSLPGGIAYSLGDGGVGLSGGQRQRLGIARALYTRPSVLFLDEATSALDVETEAEVSATLSGLRDLTKVVVAHRLSTVLHADQVVFMRDGRIVTSGTFQDVSSRVPDFARQVKLSGLEAVADR